MTSDAILTDGGQQVVCPNCGEDVSRGDRRGSELACDGCEQWVEPVHDREDTAMPFKALHRIKCTNCMDEPRLVGLHMGEYTDGTVVACACHSADCIPYELGEAELPRNWEIEHDSILFDGGDDAGE